MRMFEQQSLAATFLVFISTLIVMALSMMALNEVRDRNLMTALSGFSLEEVRGLSREAPQSPAIVQGELNRVGLEELRRRMEAIEAQRNDVRLAVIEAKVDTLFEATRLLLGAAIIYLVNVAAKAIQWASNRSSNKAQS